MIRPTLRGQRARSRAARLASADADARPRDRHRAWTARTRQRHHGRGGRPRGARDDHRGRRAARRRARVRSGPASPWSCPRADDRRNEPVYAGCHRLNGNGEMTGLEWVRESGKLTTPVAITNTHSVGVVRDALVGGLGRADDAPGDALVAAGRRRDVRRAAQRHQRLPRAGGAPAGRARRRRSAGRRRGQRRRRDGDGLPRVQGRHRDGVAGHPRRSRRVHGRRARPGQLRQARLAAGRRRAGRRGDRRRRRSRARTDTAVGPGGRRRPPPGSGSIIVVVATDAPLLPHQCERLAQRAGLGIARAGGTGGHTSGDLFIAFATGNRPAARRRGPPELRVDDVRTRRRRRRSTRCSTAPSRRPRRRSSTPSSPPRR